jgi:hypothetical protein
LVSATRDWREGVLLFCAAGVLGYAAGRFDSLKIRWLRGDEGLPEAEGDVANASCSEAVRRDVQAFFRLTPTASPEDVGD